MDGGKGKSKKKNSRSFVFKTGLPNMRTKNYCKGGIYFPKMFINNIVTITVKEG